MKLRRVTIKFVDGEIYQTTNWKNVKYQNGFGMLVVVHEEIEDMFNVSQIKYVVFDEVEE